MLRKLHTNNALTSNQMIILTTHTSQHEILTALQVGANDHIAKPFSLAMLIQHVQQALDQ